MPSGQRCSLMCSRQASSFGNSRLKSATVYLRCFGILCFGFISFLRNQVTRMASKDLFYWFKKASESRPRPSFEQVHVEIPLESLHSSEPRKSSSLSQQIASVRQSIAHLSTTLGLLES